MYNVKFIKEIINEQELYQKKSMYLLRQIPFFPVITIGYQFGKIIVDSASIQYITWDYEYDMFIISVKPTIIYTSENEFNKLMNLSINIGWKICS